MVEGVQYATCHCGAVRLKVLLAEGLKDPRHCTCSMCRRRGAIVISVPLDHLEVVEGEEYLRLYQFNTHSAKHYFCGTCGIYTHHQRRSNPREFGLNIGCLVGMENPFALEPVPVADGIHHPSDR